MNPKLLAVSTTYKARVALENLVVGQLTDSERLQCGRNADSDGLVRLFRLQRFLLENSRIRCVPEMLGSMRAYRDQFGYHLRIARHQQALTTASFAPINHSDGGPVS